MVTPAKHDPQTKDHYKPFWNKVKAGFFANFAMAVSQVLVATCLSLKVLMIVTAVVQGPVVRGKFECTLVSLAHTSTTRVQNRGLACKIHNRVFSYGWNRLDESFSEMYTCPMLR